MRNNYTRSLHTTKESQIIVPRSGSIQEHRIEREVPQGRVNVYYVALALQRKCA